MPNNPADAKAEHPEQLDEQIAAHQEAMGTEGEEPEEPEE